jgi:hypothetical protein
MKKNGQCGSKSMSSDNIQLVANFICSSPALGNFLKYSLGKRSEESKRRRVPTLVWIQRNIPYSARNLGTIIESAALSLH